MLFWNQLFQIICSLLDANMKNKIEIPEEVAMLEENMKQADIPIIS